MTGGAAYQMEHRYGACTGTWRPEGSARRCTVCRAVAYACPDVDQAIEREHQAGQLLRTLTAEGPRGTEL